MVVVAQASTKQKRSSSALIRLHRLAQRAEELSDVVCE